MFIIQTLAVLHQILLKSQMTFVLKNKDCVRAIHFILLIQKSLYVNIFANRKKLQKKCLLQDCSHVNKHEHTFVWWAYLFERYLLMFLMVFSYTRYSLSS